MSELSNGWEESYDLRFNGFNRLVGDTGQITLRHARIAVIGVGGVGSWTAEALARSGVGYLRLVDLDDVCISNTNRQLHALEDTVGQPKVEVMSQRITQINPSICCEAVQDFFTQNTEQEIITEDLDLVIDAIDSLNNKTRLLKACLSAGLPVVTVGGAGGRIDPSQIVTAPLKLSGYDGLLRLVRKKIRKEHSELWPKAAEIPCIFSREAPHLDPSDQSTLPSQRIRSQSK